MVNTLDTSTSAVARALPPRARACAVRRDRLAHALPLRYIGKRCAS
jgi:hypothetical protein